MDVNPFFRKRILFQVIYPVLLIAIVVECLLIPTRPGWPWNYKDSIACGLFLSAMGLFIVFRRQAYSEATAWLFPFFWFAAASSLILLRRWGIVATGGIGLLLFLAFVMRSRFLQEGISRDGGFKILMVAGSCFLAFGVMEGVLRLFSGWLPVELQQIISANPRNYGVTHPYIGHLQTPNNALVLSGKDYRAVHHTDGYGFRNKWPWPKSAQIVALGDSVTFGQGVEDEQAWPAIVARSFPESQLINLGLIGGGPQQYLRIYETFGEPLHPKVVLVGLFMGNDFWDAEMFDRWVKSGAGGSYMVWRDFGRPYSVSLSLQQPIKNLESALLWRAQLVARKSHIFNLMLYSLGDFIKWSPSGGKTFHTRAGTRLELAPGVLANNTKKAHPGDEVFQIVVETLQRIQNLAHHNGATAVVILQRSKEEVYLPLLGEDLPDAAVPLCAELEKSGIAYLDLLPEFRRRAAEGEVLFFENDGHPNSRGYALIGEIVSSYLKEHAKEYGL